MMDAEPKAEMGGKGLPVESAARREKRTVVWVKRIVVKGSRELCVCSVGKGVTLSDLSLYLTL